MLPVMIQRNSTCPERSSLGSAAYDLAAAEDCLLTPGGTVRVNLNLQLAVPPGFYLQLFSRSGLAAQGVVTLGGVIDSDYRESVQAILHNLGPTEMNIKTGQRVTSGVFLPCLTAAFQPVEVLPDSPRGTEGFGSSGQ